ncbi:MG2 domain-containing protein, partial [Pedobacter sp. Du54]|uniref:MG2 domain-containing protein n=1 Tax=Pedobacter anseongensis TaxID=3133439 RepID=UPI00309D675E
TYNKIFPKEKLYLSLDKPYYNAGDTIWFKTILLNGNLTANLQTDRIHIELFNDSSRLVENRVIALNNGLGYGDFALKNKLPSGTYTIRAYTNWQQNFGDDYFFQKSIYIGNVGTQTWLLDSYQKITTTGTSKTLELKTRISNIKNEAAGLRDVEVYLMSGKKRIMKADLQTSQNGIIETQIPLPDNKLAANSSFYIVDKNDRKRNAELPILLQDEEEVDLQFMPEGGYMINGIYGKVAFKAIGVDGKGKKITGTIINSKNEKIADLSTLHKGMGSFYLLPQKGDNYTAVYTLAGKEQRLNLPAAKDEGTSLRIDHLSKPDSVLIYVKATEGKTRDENYALIAQSAGEPLITTPVNLKNGFFNLKLAKKSFPDGVIHFTLFSPTQLPLNERQVFINYKQKINLKISSDKNSYSPRDSIAIELAATNETGLPIAASFAISITDNSQVKQDENQDHIVSYFLLQSDIKGNIEDGSWYFQNTEAATLLALDHLLLTQGWIGYKWNEMLKPLEPPKFKPEKDNLIEGKVMRLFNKPASTIKLTLLALGRNLFVTDTITNNEGKFVFKDLPLLDSAAYSIKIKNANGNEPAANIFVEEFIPSKISFTAKRITPWYVNADSTKLNYFKTTENQKRPIGLEQLKLEGERLKEVEIKGNKRLNDFIEKTAWDAHPYGQITEAELKKTPRKTLYDLLREKFPGFTMTNPSSGFSIGMRPIGIVMIDNINTNVVDGVVTDPGYNVTGKVAPAIATNRFIFNTLSAEDIKDIMLYEGGGSEQTYFYLDIITRSGKGPWINTSRGVYVFRPLPLYVPKEFYSPKYSIDKSS